MDHKEAWEKMMEYLIEDKLDYDHSQGWTEANYKCNHIFQYMMRLNEEIENED